MVREIRVGMGHRLHSVETRWHQYFYILLFSGVKSFPTYCYKIRLTLRFDISKAEACFRAKRDGDRSIDVLTAAMFSVV